MCVRCLRICVYQGESLANVFVSSIVAAFGDCVEFHTTAAGVSEFGNCFPDRRSADRSVNQLSGSDGSEAEKALFFFFPEERK